MAQSLNDDPWGDGRGSGTGSSPGATTTTDVNIEYGRVMDVISEGPVHGPANGLKSFFLDGTPIQNADNSFNFDGFIVQAVTGTKTQGPFVGFPESEVEVPISGGNGRRVSVSAGGFGPYVFTVATVGLTHLRLRIGCPALKKTNLTTGAVTGSDVVVTVEVKSDGTSNVYQPVTLDNFGLIQGQYSSKYTKSYKFKLPAMTSGGWTIRVTRTTADSVLSPSDGVQNDSYVYSYTEIVEGKFTHPWTAKAAIMIDSRKFPSIPSRGFEWDGRIVKIPSNYTPAILDPTTNTWTAAVYTGAWNGTFIDSPTVCFNPAWQFMDLATHTRYGTGNYMDAAKIDKWTLYTIAQYCDNMLDDGTGQSRNEPRFASSIYLQKQEDAIKVLTNMAAAFRGMLFYSSGLLMPSQDKDKSIWAIFSNSNVINGEFKYSGTARKARHTSAMVSYNDPNAGYVLTPELVEDNSTLGIQARNVYGQQQLDSVFIGCTSRAAAIRFGQWQLITERTETETVEFKTALEGVAIAPGRIIQVNDQFRSGSVRFGGRVLTGSGTGATAPTAILLDAPVVLAGGSTYTLRLALPTTTTATRADGSTFYEEGVTIEQRTVTTAAGTTSSLTVGVAFSLAPQAGAQWLLSDGATQPYYYRVLGIKETGIEYTVSALAHNPNKYSVSDTLGILSTNVNVGWTPFPPPTWPATPCSTYIYTKDNRLAYELNVGWTEPTTASPISYTAEVQFGEGRWQDMDVNGASAVMYDVPDATCKIRVRAVYRSGTSNPAETTYTVTSWSTTTPTSVSMTIA